MPLLSSSVKISGLRAFCPSKGNYRLEKYLVAYRPAFSLSRIVAQVHRLKDVAVKAPVKSNKNPCIALHADATEQCRFNKTATALIPHG